MKHCREFAPLPVPKRKGAVFGGIALAAVLALALSLAPAHAATVTRSPGSCTTDGTGNNWSNPGNAVSDNNSHATVGVNDNETSHFLQCTNYGFTLPASAVIQGISVGARLFSSNTNTADNSVRIVKGGARGGTEKATTTVYPIVEATRTYGGGADLWGLAWQASDINAGNFGIALSVRKTNTSGGSRTVYVDHLPITVTYVVPRNCVSAGNGNWSLTNTWNCGAGRGDGPPTQYDSVTINSHTVTINTSPSITSFTNNSGTLNQNGTRTLTVSGDFTNQSDATVNANNLTVNVGGNTVLNGSATVSVLNASGDVTVNGAATLTAATLNVAGKAVFNGRLTATTFNASGDVTSNSSPAFNVTHLVFQKSGTQSATFYGDNNNITNLTINAGSTVSSADSSRINLKGNLTNNGALNLPNTTWTINGTAAQSIGGGSDSTLGSLTVNNAAGLTLNRNVTVPGNLVLTNGIVTTGSNLLTVSKHCPGAVSGGSAASHVNGNLRLTYPDWSVTCTYPIGSNGVYVPMTVSIPHFNGISGGTLTGSTANGEHPQIATSNIDRTRNVNRYWSLGEYGGDTMVTLPAGGSYTVTLPFLASEVDAGSTVSTFKGAVYTATGWSDLGGSTAGNVTTYPGGRVFGSYASGAEKPAFCSSSNAPEGVDVSCHCDQFEGRTIDQPSPIFNEKWIVSTSDSTGILPSIVNGRLRLTHNTNNNAKAVTVPGIFPAAGNFMSVEFRFYAYAGNGADGVAVVLSDYTQPAKPGAFGGSLGYAQKGADSDCPNCPGFAGGWLGVGLDEFGNFPNPTEGRIGGPGARADSVTVRGSGSGTSGYRFHRTSGTLNPGVDQSGAVPAPGHLYRITVDHRNNANAWVTVERDTTGTGNNYAAVIPRYDAKAETGQAEVPTNWQISLTGSTGASTNIHEIDDLRVCAAEVWPPTGGGAAANGFQAIDEAYGDASSTEDKNKPSIQQYQTGHIYTKLVGTPFKLNVAALKDNQVLASYVGSGSKYLQVKLVDNSNDVCVLDRNQANACNAACVGKAAVDSQVLRFRSTHKGQMRTDDFNVATAWRKLAVVMRECTTAACTAFTATAPACATDQFAVRPTGATVASTVPGVMQTGTSGDPIFRAGEDTFSATVGITAGKYNGKLNIGNAKVVSPATVVGGFEPTSGFPNATPGDSTSSVTGSFTYTEVGAFELPGHEPDKSSEGLSLALPDSRPRGIWDDTWTAVDNPITQGDCILGSYSNTKDSSGKYGCLFGLTASKEFGRFIPHHFALKDATLTNRPAACDASAVPPQTSSFSYLDEPIGLSLSLVAQAKGGTTTQNYAGDLAKLVVSPSATAITKLAFGVVDTNVDPAVVLTPRLSPAGFDGAWDAGVAALSGTLTVSSLNGPGNNRVKPDGPFNKVRFGIKPVDSDGVALKDFDLDADETAGNERRSVGDETALRFGLLKLMTAYGSEQLALSVPIEARYWNGTGFIVNGSDNCTIPALSGTNVGVTGTGAALTKAPEVKPTGESGKGRIVIEAPEKKRNAYRVCLDIGADGTCSATQAPFGYLTGPWDGSDHYDRDPSARAVFGLNRGAYLYHREQY